MLDLLASNCEKGPFLSISSTFWVFQFIGYKMKVLWNSLWHPGEIWQKMFNYKKCLIFKCLITNENNEGYNLILRYIPDHPNKWINI